MTKQIENLKVKYPNAYEFIMFNLLANIATITNFLVLAIGNNFLFHNFSGIVFLWGPFSYTVENGGLCGFLSFLLSYVCAQTVNFAVQRKVVFHANNKLGIPIVIYIFTVLVVYAICLYLPTLLIGPLKKLFGDFAMYIANIVNILVQVVIIYPVMKCLIMKHVDEDDKETLD